jgi:AcrR family transcriptional regulator
MSAQSIRPARSGRAVRRDALLNREKILTVAAELMAERGRNVPLAEIAAAAGVGVGTFYRGYPDRTALLHALEHRAYGLLIEILDRIEEAGQTGADAVETFLNE